MLPFEEIYVTAAKILGLDEITLRILSALGISIGARDERAQWAARLMGEYSSKKLKGLFSRKMLNLR